MSINWSRELIETLATHEVLSLQKNALNQGHLDISKRCEEVLTTRKHALGSSAPRSRSAIKQIESECSKVLSDFALYLHQKYDISAAAAAAKSVGVKGFIAHRLTSKNGQAKLGGDQLTGKVTIDRYISYRVRNEPISLVALLISADSEDQLMWQVLGSPHHFKNFKPYSQLRPYATDTEGGLYTGGEEFIDFAAASTLFESVLAGLADPIAT